VDASTVGKTGNFSGQPQTGSYDGRITEIPKSTRAITAATVSLRGLFYHRRRA